MRGQTPAAGSLSPYNLYTSALVSENYSYKMHSVAAEPNCLVILYLTCTTICYILTNILLKERNDEIERTHFSGEPVKQGST